MKARRPRYSLARQTPAGAYAWRVLTRTIGAPVPTWRRLGAAPATIDRAAAAVRALPPEQQAAMLSFIQRVAGDL